MILEDILTLIHTMLELEEFEIICVNSIKKAWDILHEGVAVVVLDLMMPDISGRDFLKEFRTYKKFNDHM